MQLPLDSLRDFIGYDPFHFWGMADNLLLPVRSPDCNTVVYERAYQGSDRSGRHEIRRAIAQAHAKLASVLRYPVSPTAYTETDLLVQDAALSGSNVGYGAYSGAWGGAAITTGRRHLFVTHGHLRALGAQTLTTLGTPAVVYSDRDGDGVLDTFTVTLASAAYPSTIRLYPVEADRLAPGPLVDREIIAPASITTTGATLTITGPAWLMVRPVRYATYPQGMNLNPIEEPAIYMQTVRVVAVGVDATAAVTVTGVNGSPCCAATPIGTVIPATILDAQTGLIGLDYVCGCSGATAVSVQYIAGLPLTAAGAIVEPWATVLMKLAIAEMARPICACDTAQAIVNEYAVDLALIDGRITKYQLSPGDLVNPFGTRRGHVEAWRMAQRLGHSRGFIA